MSLADAAAVTRAFSCRRCGHCCSGEGGIILRDKDTARLARHFSLSPENFLERYASRRNGKWSLGAANGQCVFYGIGSIGGCGVHGARPDICRAWPFFHGNLVDGISLDMAKAYCPGIDPACAFTDFSRIGQEYLTAEGLSCSPKEPGAPAALFSVDGAAL